jgi:hypothetical protein
MRRPQVNNLPEILLSSEKPPRTPVLEGKVARPLGELIPLPDVTPEEVEASIRQAELNPVTDPIWVECHEDLLKHSLAYFAAEMISGPPELPYNGKFLIGKHHEDWDELIHTKEKMVLEAARDHGKSYFFSMAYPIWRAGYTHPGKLGYIFSNTQPLAEAFLAMVKEEVITNPKLRHLAPTSVTDHKKWGSAKEIEFRNGSTIRARGMGVKVRGGHPYWAIADDILEDDDIYSETIRNRHVDYFLSAINNMVVPGGQLIVVGTPMHFADLYGYLRETGEYHCAKYPAIDDQGRLLFPERYNAALLAKRRRELGSPSRFAREFLCQPLSDEASLFPSKLFEGGDVRIPYQLGLGHKFWERRGCITYTGVDFAMSASSGADYTVIFTVANDQRGNRWLANIRRGRGWGFQRQLDEIKEEYAIMRPGVIHAEANQMQRIFTDELIRETDMPIRKFFTTGVQPKNPSRKGMTQVALSKHHLDRGVPSLRMSLENRKWRIPRGDARSIELTDLWMGELQAMSWQDGKVVSVGAHDDLVMSTWMCDSAVRMGGFNFSFGEEDLAPASFPEIKPEEATAVDKAMVQVPEQLEPAAEEIDTSLAPGIERVDKADTDPYVQPKPTSDTQSHDDESWKPQQGAPLPGSFGAGSGFGGNF